jgi:hypothetical protein
MSNTERMSELLMDAQGDIWQETTPGSNSWYTTAFGMSGWTREQIDLVWGPVGPIPQNPVRLLDAYAREYPFAGINRSTVAPKVFAALRAVIKFTDPENADSEDGSSRLFNEIRSLITTALSE